MGILLLVGVLLLLAPRPTAFSRVDEGVVAFFNGLSHSNLPGAGWAVANGVITFILGLLIVTLKFWGLLWVLGTLVGISFLFSGIELIAFSSSMDDGQDPPAIA